MTPQEIMEALEQANQELSQKNDELQNLAELKSYAERDYNVAFAKAELQLKIEGNPITIIKDLVKGDEKVSLLKIEWDIKESVYRACLEKIKDIRTNIDSYRSILSWMKAEM